MPGTLDFREQRVTQKRRAVRQLWLEAYSMGAPGLFPGAA